MPGGTRIEMLLPRVKEDLLLAPTPNTGRAPTLLLIDSRDRVRAQLHNFFESAGYNMIEACDRSEALALGEMHEGSLDMLIAEPADAKAILEDLRATHPAVASLLMVDTPEASSSEIRQPFTQRVLLERVVALLASRAAPAAETDSALSTSSS
jgi:DNA-binding response OmpR family regulator